MKIEYYENEYHPGVSCLVIDEALIQEVPNPVCLSGDYISDDISQLKKILIENWDDKNRCWKKFSRQHNPEDTK